jgi:hypothetical protein
VEKGIERFAGDESGQGEDASSNLRFKDTAAAGTGGADHGAGGRSDASSNERTIVGAVHRFDIVTRVDQQRRRPQTMAAAKQGAILANSFKIAVPEHMSFL